MKDRELVLKLLQLTRSENDNEALSAMRQANKLIGDWTTIVKCASCVEWRAKYNKLVDEYNYLARVAKLLAHESGKKKRGLFGSIF